jgi:hypothetical protein
MMDVCFTLSKCLRTLIAISFAARQKWRMPLMWLLGLTPPLRVETHSQTINLRPKNPLSQRLPRPQVCRAPQASL